jgi:hypothetical protein
VSGAEHEREYRALAERVRALITASVPAGARVLVITRGDEQLLRLRGREGQHFPQSPTGLYAGHHPAAGVEAVEELERLAERGAEYLAIPATALWWLDHYPELRERLDGGGELVASEPDTGVVYSLGQRVEARPRTIDELEAERIVPQAAALVRALLPDDAPVAIVGASGAHMDLGDRRRWRLPAPGPGLAACDIAEQADAAIREGARYVVVVEDDDPTRRLDARLRQRIVGALRPVFDQGVAQGFEVPERTVSA